MKRKTPNTERRTPNIEWKSNAAAHVREEEPGYGTLVGSKPASKNRYDLEERLLEFAARIVRLVDALPTTRAGNHIAGQLLRCGTSPLANHGEVEAAESRNDFIHKLRICLKELRETSRWLCLVSRVRLVKSEKILPLVEETNELVKIFVSSVRTAHNNRP